MTRAQRFILALASARDQNTLITPVRVNKLFCRNRAQGG
jgi:hypothetical protein